MHTTLGIDFGTSNSAAAWRRGAEPARALRLEGEGLERHFFAVRAAGRTPKRVTQAFMEFARSELGALAAGVSP